MLWDCAYCGQKKNLGKTHRFCPTCGAAQDEKARYFPSDAERVAVEDHVFVGRDKECPACGSPSSARAERCGSCGSPLDGAKQVALVSDQVGESFAGETQPKKGPARMQKAAKEPRPPRWERKRSADGKPKQPWSSQKKWAVGGGLVSSTAGLVMLLGWTETVTMQVESSEWVRKIEIEKFGPVEHSDWCDELPSGARVKSRSREVRSSEKVADGETCRTVRSDNGDGTYSESESCTTKYETKDVYDSRCDYEVDEWSRARTLELRGPGGKELAWPAVSLARAGDCAGCEREGARSELYRVKLAGVDAGGERHEETCEVPRGHYDRMTVGSKWKVPVGSATGMVFCTMIEGLPEY